MGEINIKVSLDGPEPPPPATTRARLRLLVLADLGASRAAPPTLLREAKDLHLLLEDLSPRLVLDVPNRLSAEPATLECRLHLRSFKDLAPEALASALPELRPALELRRSLARAKGGAPPSVLRETLARCAGAPGLDEVLRIAREALEAGAPQEAAGPSSRPGPSPSPEDAVGRIMELVDLPSEQERAAAAIGKVVGAVGGRRGATRSTPPRLDGALEQLEALIARQTEALLAHPDLQRIEAAWRGLKLLVDRGELRREVEIAVVHLERPTVGDPLVESLLADPELDLVLAPCLFESPPSDAALVQWLAELAERHQVPLVTSVAAGFFGVAAEEAGAMGYPVSLLERPQYTKWNSLRRKEHARWVAVAFNRVLLREAAGQGTPLWGDPVWLVGILAARSHARVGWPTEIRGQWVEDLPIHSLRDERGRRVQVPLECLLSQQLAGDLAECGFLVLAAQDNSDAAFVPHAPMLFQASGATPAVSLPYQLLAGRVVRAVADHLGQPGPAGGEAARELERRVAELIADTGAGATVSVELRDGEALLRLRTGMAVLGGVALELSFLLPG